MNTETKEQSIFSHSGNKIQTDDRDIQVIARLEEPLIVVLGNVLSEEECEALIELSKDRMNRSKVSGSRVAHEIRTSSGMFFDYGENELVAKIEKRIAQIMDIPLEHAEEIQVLNYQVGQEYKAHFDFFKNAENPRISTLVMYLNDVEEGGETTFPKLNFSVSPQKGMAVYFEYFYSNQEVNELTLHSGAPVSKGDKWAATQWMRRKRVK